MNLIFRTRRLERCFHSQAEAIKAWGPRVGRRYVLRMEFLAAASWNDVRARDDLRLHRLSDPWRGQHAISLDFRWRLHFTYDRRSDTITIEEVTQHYGD
jgi:proteic killer suppression protein